MTVDAAATRSAPPDAEYPWRREDVGAYFELPREVRSAQLERRVVAAIDRAWTNNRFYAQHWSARGLRPGDIRGLDDLASLPTCTIDDFRGSIEREPPYGIHFGVDEMREVDIVLSTGGTTGRPRPMLVTRADQVALGTTAARVWQWIGVERGDVVQVLAPFSLHGAAWLAKWGLEIIGARLIPSGGGGTTPTLQQIELMRQFSPTAILALPNYLRIVAAAAAERGGAPADLGIERILVGAEVLTPAMRSEIEETWRAPVWDVYGTVDTLVWSSVDCDANRAAGGSLGTHLWSDEIIAEILDEDGNPCSPGEYGDLTFTSWLSATGPKFRFRTGDRAAITDEPCPCGLDTPRLLPIHGRTDDRLRFHGVSLWPSSIDEVIHRAAPGVREYVVVAESSGMRETLCVRIENAAGDEGLARAVVDEFKASFGISVVAEVVAPGGTAELTGQGKQLKAKRIVDRRGEGI